MFKPGVSGNPGGRPSIARALDVHGTTTAEVLAKLAGVALECLDDPTASERSREYAHTWLTNYTIGKPAQAVDLTVETNMKPLDLSKLNLTTDQLEALAAGDSEPSD